jgi:hypothetical protein
MSAAWRRCAGHVAEHVRGDVLPDLSGTPHLLPHDSRSRFGGKKQVCRGVPDRVEPPVLLDSLPWSHPFGGDHNAR